MSHLPSLVKLLGVLALSVIRSSTLSLVILIGAIAAFSSTSRISPNRADMHHTY